MTRRWRKEARRLVSALVFVHHLFAASPPPFIDRDGAGEIAIAMLLRLPGSYKLI